MSTWAPIVIVWAIGNAVLFAISRDIDVRDHRRKRLAFSQPVLLFLGFLFGDFSLGAFLTPFALAACMMILFLIWHDAFTHSMGKGLISGLYGDGRAGGSVAPYFGFAQSLINEDNLGDAETELQEQLAKDPHNFDGNRMLAAIYQEWEQPDKAIKQLDIAAQRPDIPESHAEFIEEARKQLLEMKEGSDKEKRW